MTFLLKKLAIACLVALIPLSAQKATAHPHEWVQMRIQMLFNEQGEANGMRFNWLFDEFFTAYALSDYDTVTQQDLDTLLKEILGNIHEFSYMTHIEVAGERIDTQKLFANAIPNKAGMSDIRLQLDFDVPFTTPINVQEKPLRYAIFDSTFYIAMHHFDDDDAVKLIDAPDGCKVTINPADPDPDMAAFAASLDQSQSGGDGLGIHFAEWVDVQCAQS